MGEPAIQLPAECEAASTRALTLPEQARALAVVDLESFQAAGAFLVEIKRHMQAIDGAFDPSVQSAFQTHRRILGIKNQALEPPKQAEVIVKASMASYQREQERLRIEAERKAAEERRQLEEQARRDALAERARLQREEEDRRLEVAAIAESVGDTEGAARILAETPVVAMPAPAVIVPAPVEVAPIAKAAGVSFRTVYKWRVLNEKAIKREYLCPDEKKINGVVRALGLDAAAAIGGIDVLPDTAVSARSR